MESDVFSAADILALVNLLVVWPCPKRGEPVLVPEPAVLLPKLKPVWLPKKLGLVVLASAESLTPPELWEGLTVPKESAKRLFPEP